MSLAIVRSGAVLGVAALPVVVETHLSNGLPGFSIVGLPETAVKESKDRVRSALINSGYVFPAGRITVNLAPADVPKAGGRYDLAIALGILAASGQLPVKGLEGREFYGELALSGEIRGVPGLLPAAMRSMRCAVELVVPRVMQREMSAIPALSILYAESLQSLVEALTVGFCPGSGNADSEPWGGKVFSSLQGDHESTPDFCEVKGQLAAKRAIEIAVSGGHNLLMSGPPGAGKTLLASCLPGILPPLDELEALEVAAIHSVYGTARQRQDWYRPPLRQPHHSISSPALLGGSANPRPGEISLSHRGVLFLDELPEFDRGVLECLREPMESGEIHVSRAARKVVFPARFMLVAAMNPCACGYSGIAGHRCQCTALQRQRYRARLSGPLLDRFDIRIDVLPVEVVEMGPATHVESSKEIASRVLAARSIQRQRNAGGWPNARLSGDELTACCRLDPQVNAVLQQATVRLQLSMRSRVRVIRVARTIADMDSSSAIGAAHLLEALAYRPAVNCRQPEFPE